MDNAKIYISYNGLMVQQMRRCHRLLDDHYTLYCEILIPVTSEVT
jgi:hypothetical protein